MNDDTRGGRRPRRQDGKPARQQRAGPPPSRGGKGGDRRSADDRGRRSRDGGGTTRNRSAAAALAKSGSVQLPRWVHDAMVRVTPKSRIAGALAALEEAAAAFVQGRHRRALQRAEAAKALSPRDATVRELLGLSAYRLGQWDLALKELRTYRRLSGDTTHLPVEMDVQRALGRDDGVADAWKALNDRGANPATMKEGRVVYASHLLDRGRAREAWDVVRPKRIVDNPFEEDLRLWYVAARAAAALGDLDAARRLQAAITNNDPAFPGLEELGNALGS